jgi:hypothetical protein
VICTPDPQTHVTDGLIYWTLDFCINMGNICVPGGVFRQKAYRASQRKCYLQSLKLWISNNNKWTEGYSCIESFCQKASLYYQYKEHSSTLLKPQENKTAEIIVSSSLISMSLSWFLSWLWNLPSAIVQLQTKKQGTAINPSYQSKGCDAPGSICGRYP